MKVLVYGQRLEKKDKPYLDDLIDSLISLKATIAFHETLKEKLVLLKHDFSPHKYISTYEELKSFSPDFFITLGGDGTILRAITLVKDTGIPILGINLGRLGFLSSIEKTKIRDTFHDIGKGNFFVEERNLLALSCNLPLFEDTQFALNDFTITKRDDSSMIIIRAYIDGELLNAYWADGIIVASPTGSTGYSLSCGGPIIFPDADSIVITPIAPHNLNVRPIVIPNNSKITLEVEGRAENFMCTLDSRFETITAEHTITISKCSFSIRLAHPKGDNFMNTIRSKLMWGLDMRN
jgi:NAD+ kinase